MRRHAGGSRRAPRRLSSLVALPQSSESSVSGGSPRARPCREGPPELSHPPCQEYPPRARSPPCREGPPELGVLRVGRAPLSSESSVSGGAPRARPCQECSPELGHPPCREGPPELGHPLCQECPPELGRVGRVPPELGRPPCREVPHAVRSPDFSLRVSRGKSLPSVLGVITFHLSLTPGPSAQLRPALDHPHVLCKPHGHCTQGRPHGAQGRPAEPGVSATRRLCCSGGLGCVHPTQSSSGSEQCESPEPSSSRRLDP